KGLMFRYFSSKIKTPTELKPRSEKNITPGTKTPQEHSLTLKNELFSMLNSITPTHVEDWGSRPKMHSNVVQSSNPNPRRPDRKKFELIQNRGGGDCMLHALSGRNLSPMENIDLRKQLADTLIVGDFLPDVISGTEIVSGLAQSGLFPAAENEWTLSPDLEELTKGKDFVSKTIYAAMIKIPGVYLGEYEAQAYSALHEKNVYIATYQGELREITPDQISTLMHLSDTNDIFYDAIQQLSTSQVVLYKSENHWERIRAGAS
ncbi:hypothetical protein, partial [Pseudomonas moorei]|uniref:hypothetical protein n=1 Tax=Pseudomonas moorei TaxID=395599 RepID=UPI00200CD435